VKNAKNNCVYDSDLMVENPQLSWCGYLRRRNSESVWVKLIICCALHGRSRLAKVRWLQDKILEFIFVTENKCINLWKRMGEPQKYKKEAELIIAEPSLDYRIIAVASILTVEQNL
jgi:hypothetical protein